MDDDMLVAALVVGGIGILNPRLAFIVIFASVAAFKLISWIT
jgi:hypothetical protein